MEEELNAAGEKLARLIVSNQTLYPQPNMKLAGAAAAMSALTYAMMSGKINEKVLNILVEEALGSMMEMMNTPNMQQ